MRSTEDIKRGLQAIENRIDRDGEYMGDDPLAGLVMSIHQGQRAALQNVVQSEHGEHWEMYDSLASALATDLGLAEYCQVQAMINAHEWAQGNRDSL